MIERGHLKDIVVAELENAVSAALDDIAPAIAIAAFHRGKLLLHDSWGWIDPDSCRYPVTTETLFDLASLTKVFTITAFLSLASEQQLKLDTALVEIVPEFGQITPRSIDGGQDPHTKEHLPVAKDCSGQYVHPQDVTLWHLLTHTSGLPPWRDVYSVAAVPQPPASNDTISRSERWGKALHTLYEYPFVGHPGSAMRYSDIGLMLLGEVVSRLNGTPGDLESAIQARVLAPAAIENVMFNPVRSNKIPLEQIAPTEFDATWRKRRVWGEVHDENACGVGGIAGHAGLFGRVLDVARFGQLWLESPVDTFAITPQLAQQAITEQARTDGKVRGLGWMLKSAEDSSAGDVFHSTSYGHSGFTGTSLWIDPTKYLVVVLLTNRVYAGRGKPGIHAFRRQVNDILAGAVQ